jgi:hypothetical protein
MAILPVSICRPFILMYSVAAARACMNVVCHGPTLIYVQLEYSRPNGPSTLVLLFLYKSNDGLRTLIRQHHTAAVGKLHTRKIIVRQVSNDFIQVCVQARSRYGSEEFTLFMIQITKWVRLASFHGVKFLLDERAVRRVYEDD